MMRIRALPPLEAITDNLSYDPKSGRFQWAVDKCGRYRDASRQAGCVTSQERRIIHIAGYGQFMAHRLAWKMVYGCDPVGEIDHIDGNALNNAISNLREATSSQQKMNRGAQNNNRSGLKGAYFHACHKGKQWRSQIKVGSRLIFLGYFATAQEAHEAYIAASKIHFGAFFAERSAAANAVEVEARP